ncbi:hypothetical protein Hanom_Chr17g01580821 [Helianthus anomalus]
MCMNCYTIVLVFCIVLELCLVIQICIISSDVADMSGFCRWNVLGTQDVWSLKVFKMDIARETIGNFVDYGILMMHHMEKWMGITEER